MYFTLRNNYSSNQIINLDKILHLPYSIKMTFSFEELYTIVYNFVLYNKNNKNLYLESSESDIQYDLNKDLCNNNADIYLKKIYKLIDTRNCIYNNITELCDISLYAIRTRNNINNYKFLLENLHIKKKNKQSIIILCLQKCNINEYIIKKILFTQLSKL